MCVVEWKKLGDVCKIMNGKDYKSLNDGNIPVYGSGGIMTYVDTFVYNRPSVLLPRKGSLNNVFYVDEPFWTVDTIYWTNINEEIITPKYFFYYMDMQDLEKLNVASGAVPSLTQTILNKINIPIPPLAKQQEIVSHLDTFTTLISNLESELDMRRKQYEHYRNQLLDFEGVEGVEWKTLGEVCIKTENIKWKNTTNDYYYIDLSSVERESNRINEVQSICKDNAPSRAQQIVLGNDILFGTTRPTLKRLCIVPQEYDNQICSTGFCILRANINVINYRLLYYLLTTMSFYTYVENNQEGAGYPSISNSKIMKYEVPIPSLPTQQEIVEKLDAFENLIQSLELEIKLRKQQYEYYREKLLTFEKE